MEHEVRIYENHMFSRKETSEEMIASAEMELRRRLAEYVQKNALVSTRVEERIDATITTVMLKIPSGIDRNCVDDKLYQIYQMVDKEKADKVKSCMREIWEEVFGREVKPRWMT